MGMVAASNMKRQHYWRHWQDSIWPHFDDYLQSLPCKEQISVCQAVIEWTRQGKLGQGTQIKAGLVQDAISAIGKNFELKGYGNPPYKPGTTDYHIRIERQLESFKQTDPNPNRPANVTTTSSAGWNTKIYNASQTSNIQPSPHSCNWGIMPYCILFLIMCGQIHTITKQPINKNTTIPAGQRGFLLRRQTPHLRRTQGKPRITNPGMAENRQSEKWLTRSNYITTGN